MKYLFFDLEFATSKGGCKICEYGYVVTNEKFEVLKRGIFIIDPMIKRSEWDWFAAKNILTRKVKEYEACPRFDEYYNEIKEMIEDADIVLGHSLDGDAKALNDDCKRYELDSIDFDFYDVKLFYKEYNNSKNDTSVSNILKSLNIQGDSNEHDAESDAYNTMLELKAMLDNLALSLDDLITLCPHVKNVNKNYEVESIVKNREARENEMNEYINGEGDNTIRKWSRQKILFLQFLDNVKPSKDCEKTLDGLKFSISINYEINHYRQMLNIIQILCNLGATYVLKASKADVFIKYDLFDKDGNLEYCSKTKYVAEANANGANIKTIDFSEFLNMLNITEEQLNNLPMVSFDCLYRDDSIIKDKKTLKIINKQRNIELKKKESSTVSIGDLFGDFFKEFQTVNTI